MFGLALNSIWLGRRVPWVIWLVFKFKCLCQKIKECQLPRGHQHIHTFNNKYSSTKSWRDCFLLFCVFYIFCVFTFFTFFFVFFAFFCFFVFLYFFVFTFLLLYFCTFVLCHCANSWRSSVFFYFCIFVLCHCANSWRSSVFFTFVFFYFCTLSLC